MADDHAFYKLAAKEIAYQHGAAVTFMAKVNQLEGNSCHIHCSFWEGDQALFPGTGEGGHSPLYDQYFAGQVERTHELSFFFAPNINSYKRYAYGSFAPTTLLWGRDNRTAAFRSVGHGQGLRLETRIAGGASPKDPRLVGVGWPAFIGLSCGGRLSQVRAFPILGKCQTRCRNFKWLQPRLQSFVPLGLGCCLALYLLVVIRVKEQ